MKWVLVITDILLLAVVYIAARYHYDFKEPKPNKALNRTPELVKNVEATTAAIETRQVKIEDISGNNPFHPQRGKKEDEPVSAPTTSKPTPQHSQAKFTLAGICKLGDTIGAIIIQKNVRRAPSRPTRRWGRRLRPPVAAPSPQSQNNNQRRFFKLNDEVGDGYKLVSVTQSSATLQSSSDKIELKIEHVRFDQESKKTPNARPAPKPPVTAVGRTNKLINIPNPNKNNSRVSVPPGTVRRASRPNRPNWPSRINRRPRTSRGDNKE